MAVIKQTTPRSLPSRFLLFLLAGVVIVAVIPAPLDGIAIQAGVISNADTDRKSAETSINRIDGDKRFDPAANGPANSYMELDLSFSPTTTSNMSRTDQEAAIAHIRDKKTRLPRGGSHPTEWVCGHCLFHCASFCEHFFTSAFPQAR